MSLSDFIRSEMTEILAAWTAFAKKVAPFASEMSTLALADHAEEMLLAIALDIETHQSEQQQFEKSQGDQGEPDKEESAAGRHGRLRHASNFSLLQLSSEYRALRATVLRLWLPRVQHPSEAAMLEMVRFNEAIDQALAESVASYAERSERMRELFLAVLGHDLRAPLATMFLLADQITRRMDAQDPVTRIGKKVKRNAMLMIAIVTDLLGYARSQMGAGMPIVRATVDAEEVCKAAVADANAMYPNSRFVFRPSGNLVGMFDSVRLQQLITNLLINAAQYSAEGRDVTLFADGSKDSITIKVCNVGPVIPERCLGCIFQPLVQLEPDSGDDTRKKTSLGLGLYIAQEITSAHRGTIVATSSLAEGTVITVNLPRSSN